MSAPEAAAAPAAAPIAVKGMGLVKLVPVLLVFSLVNLGGTGFVAHRLLQPLKMEIEESHPKQQGTARGPTVPFEAFVVNLNELGSSRYLKAAIEVEVTDPVHVEPVTAAKSLIRDEVLRYLSGLSVAQTLGEENKLKISAEVHQRMERVVGERRVARVLISEFVVQ